MHAPGTTILEIICSAASVYLHVTAVSGHCSVRSVVRICLSDRQVRFLLPPTGLSANEHFLKTGFVSIVVIVLIRNVKVYSEVTYRKI